jgi:hypothetical protein
VQVSNWPPAQGRPRARTHVRTAGLPSACRRCRSVHARAHPRGTHTRGTHVGHILPEGWVGTRLLRPVESRAAKVPHAANQRGHDEHPAHSAYAARIFIPLWEIADASQIGPPRQVEVAEHSRVKHWARAYKAARRERPLKRAHPPDDDAGWECSGGAALGSHASAAADAGKVWQGWVGAPGGGARPPGGAPGGLRNAVGSAETMPAPVARLSHWKAIETETVIPAGANT